MESNERDVFGNAHCEVGMKGGKSEFYPTFRVRNCSFIVQCYSNGRGRFMALMEYVVGGKQNFIFILVHRGWRMVTLMRGVYGGWESCK